MSYIDQGFRQGWIDAEYEQAMFKEPRKYAGAEPYPANIKDSNDCTRAAFNFGHKAGWKAFFKRGASSE